MKKLLLILMVMLTIACTGTGSRNLSLPDTDEVPVIVKNDSWSDITVYYYAENRPPKRLGKVVASTEERFYIKGYGTYSFRIVQFVTHDNITLPKTMVGRNSMVEIQVLNHLPLTNIMVYGREY